MKEHRLTDQWQGIVGLVRMPLGEQRPGFVEMASGMGVNICAASTSPLMAQSRIMAHPAARLTDAFSPCFL